MPELAADRYKQHAEALRASADRFFTRRYAEAGGKYREALELQLKEMEIRDAEISGQLDDIVEREQGNVLLLLGEDHCPATSKAQLVRWEPKKYTNLAREMADAIRNLDKAELEDLLFRRIGMFWVESYWEQSGEAGINAIERAIRILDALLPSGLKELYDFITEGKRADVSFRALLWLKRNGFITEEEL